MLYYNSPRWTNELLDCSMPMTFDTYSACSYNCLYCFAFFQKSHSLGKKEGESSNYQKNEVRPVNTEKIKAMFDPDYKGQFGSYIKNRFVMQWGGMADQFDENERAQGKTLELLKTLRKINYPLCFSTKATWFLKDDRYREVFAGVENWDCKFSIINLDPQRSRRMEVKVDSPQARLEAIKEYTKLTKSNAILRLRPFIIGFTDREGEYLELIKQARDAGATAVTTEFLCLDGRADDKLKARYNAMSKLTGYDILDFYKNNSNSTGYYRLTRKAKEPYVKKMKELCDKLGMRFYVSDAHFKEYSSNGSCCGLNESCNYSRGQFTEALIIAKTKGKVYFSDIRASAEKIFDGIHYERLEGYNIKTPTNRVKYKNYSTLDFFRSKWNNPNDANSPYKYFGGVLKPIGLDDNKDVIYEYVGDKV